MTMAYVGHLLETNCGDRWFKTGKLDVKFTNPCWPNDVISIKGVATGTIDDDPSREGIFAWIEKDGGTVVLIANASVAAD
ncbi:MAG: hypothetical protein VB933_10465 [Pseudomonadales bacterium]